MWHASAWNTCWRNGTALCASDVENIIPLKNFSDTAPNSGYPSPQPSNKSLFVNFHLVINSIFSPFDINLPSALFFLIWSDSTTRSNICRTSCQSFIITWLVGSYTSPGAPSICPRSHVFFCKARHLLAVDIRCTSRL